MTNLRALLIAVSIASGAVVGRAGCEGGACRSTLTAIAVVSAVVATAAFLRIVGAGGDHGGARRG